MLLLQFIFASQLLNTSSSVPHRCIDELRLQISTSIGEELQIIQRTRKKLVYFTKLPVKKTRDGSINMTYYLKPFSEITKGLEPLGIDYRDYIDVTENVQQINAGIDELFIRLEQAERHLDSEDRRLGNITGSVYRNYLKSPVSEPSPRRNHKYGFSGFGIAKQPWQVKLLSHPD